MYLAIPGQARVLGVSRSKPPFCAGSKIVGVPTTRLTGAKYARVLRTIGGVNGSGVIAVVLIAPPVLHS